MSRATCWQVLRLERSSSERDIRRQYAALLKVTRPEDDPAAFQQLREAYEQALGEARRRSDAAQAALESSAAGELELDIDDVEPAPRALHPYDESDELSLLDVPTVTAAPSEAQQQHALMQQLFSQISLDNLDECLRIAQEHNAQTPFEHHLLQLCLSDHADAEAVAEWALVRFDWLLPWQSSALPRSALQVLAERLLRWKFAHLDRLLAAQQEAAAVAHIDQLLSHAWLDSLDRREWLQERLLSWLTSNSDWSPAFFDALCERLELQPDDYQLEHNPQWRALVHRLQGQHLWYRLQQQLVQKKTVLFEDQAAQLLLKDMGPGRRRRLIDRMGEAAWNACAELDHLLSRRYPDVLAKLGLRRLPDWRPWHPQDAGSLWLWWLLLISFAAVVLSGPTSPRTDAEILLTRQTRLGEMLGISVGIAVLLYFASEVWRHCARTLAWVDGWLSHLLLPAALARQGAGCLLLRHVVPCLTFGALGGLWVAHCVEQAGLLAWLVGAVLGVAALLYCLFSLRLLPPGRTSQARGKAAFIGNVLGVILLLCGLLYVNGNLDSHPTGEASGFSPGIAMKQDVQPARAPGMAPNPFGLNDTPLVDPGLDPDLQPSSLSPPAAKKLSTLKYTPPASAEKKSP